MKKFTFVIVLLLPVFVFGQKHTETITKELKFAQQSTDNHLTIYNTNGSIDVEGYSGSTIQVEVVKTISANSQGRLDQGKKEINVAVEEKGFDILVYMDSPCTNLKYNGNNFEDGDRWNTCSNNCNWSTKYNYDLSFTVKVPYNLDLTLRTVNNGDITLKNVSSNVKVNNINGSISLDEVSGAVNAHTINGKLDVVYTKNPTKDSRYYSLNGDVNAHFKKGLSAQLSFESFNGDFYTNIDNIKMLPTTIETKKKTGKGIKYKVGGKSKMQVGNGKTHLDFETFNGNVYVKEL